MCGEDPADSRNYVLEARRSPMPPNARTQHHHVQARSHSAAAAYVTGIKK